MCVCVCVCCSALDVETHTVNPSRASEITMAEDHTTTGECRTLQHSVMQASWYWAQGILNGRNNIGVQASGRGVLGE